MHSHVTMFRAVVCIVALATVLTIGSGAAQAQNDCLLYIDCILEGEGLHALLYRDGQEYPLSTIECLMPGDSMNTFSDRVQITDPADDHFRIGQYTLTWYDYFPCFLVEYGIYLELGEIYSNRQSCIKIRTSCWAHNIYEYTTKHFLRQEPDTTSHYFALDGPLGVWEYYPECIDTSLFTVDSSMHAITTGYWGDPDYQVTFEEISQEDLTYIVEIYGYDWSEEVPILSEWGMIILALLVLAAGTIAVIWRRKVAIPKAFD